ncbi:MAG: hypothetical protein AAGJ37_03490 [Pseudomonadota bacterium]
MNEAINASHNVNDSFALHTINNSNAGAFLSPYFSMRKLRMVYNELALADEFEFKNFDEFKQTVLSSPVPQLELSKWQAIASRR